MLEEHKPIKISPKRKEKRKPSLLKPKILDTWRYKMNTAINAAIVETTTTTAAENTAEIVVNDPVQVVLDNENATIADFEELANKGHYNFDFVIVMQNIADNVARKMEPKNYDAEIGKLQVELLKTKEIEGRFGIMEEITNLMKEQQGEGSEIRNRLSGVGFHEIAVAYAKDIQNLVDSVVIDQLRKSQNAVLKFKRGTKGAAVDKADKKAGPTVVIDFKGEKVSIAEGRGPIPKVLSEIVAQFAKEGKLEIKGIKPIFVEALKANKVKGVKFLEAKAAEV